MNTKTQFSAEVLAAFQAAKIIGLRAGAQPHRFIGVWVVVVRERVFVRPWNNKARGWYNAFLEEPRGLVQLDEQQLPVRALKARGERLKDEIDRAYAAKYPTPGSRNYVEGFAQPERRATTIEFVPEETRRVE